MRHWREEKPPMERKKEKRRNRRLAAPTRANYDPTWRVKGNPICITRRAITVTRLRYLHYKYSPFLPPFRLFPPVDSLECRRSGRPCWALCARGIFIKTDEAKTRYKTSFEKRSNMLMLRALSISTAEYRILHSVCNMHSYPLDNNFSFIDRSALFSRIIV